MIVSVSGKIGSGKDTVGEIIRYLSTNPSGNQHHSKTITFEAFREFSYSSQAKRCEWQIKKFADKLKDIVCIILGCTREQLEIIRRKSLVRSGGDIEPMMGVYIEIALSKFMTKNLKMKG